MTALPVPEHLPLKAVQKVLPHFSLPAPVLQDLPDILSDTLLPLLSEELFLLFLRRKNLRLTAGDVELTNVLNFGLFRHDSIPFPAICLL